MYSAFGIITPTVRNIWVEGLESYRPIGAFSFMGRYRVIDFPVSNMSNSGIDRIQVYLRKKPLALIDHLGSGRHYNINSKRGKLQVLVSENSADHDIYNTDVATYLENMEQIQKMYHPYVVIAPGYMIYTQDYSELLQAHTNSGADITLLYHSVDNAKDEFLNCNVLDLNKQKGVLSIERNPGTAKSRNISMDTYVMKTDLFIELLHKAKELSSMYTLADIINISCNELDVRGVAHRGYFATMTDFKSVYNANIAMIDHKTARSLFSEDWPIYTKTNDSCPTQYFETADVKTSIVSNGSLIEGTVEHSVIGRGCKIRKGAIVKNSIILSGAEIGEGVHVENQLVDKRAKLIHAKEVIAEEGNPGYIRRDDTL
ncbi:MAG: glucose-1-phosphate adenylyltransferase subunit GlgD [Hespellia sp.]|nr:glucose-1-phosphate adenylyltransferase subunit GlgD [Hespellia sp.]